MFFVLVPFLKRAPRIIIHLARNAEKGGGVLMSITLSNLKHSFMCPVPDVVPDPVPDSGSRFPPAPYTQSKPDISSISSFLLLWRSINAGNVTFRISLWWSIHIINPVDKTKLSCNTLAPLTQRHSFFRNFTHFTPAYCVFLLSKYILYFFQLNYL